MKQNSMQQVLFYFSRSTDCIEIFELVYKTFGNIKKSLEKKNILQNIS